MATISYLSELGPIGNNGRIKTDDLTLYVIVELNVDPKRPYSLGHWGHPFTDLDEALSKRDESNEYYRHIGRTFAVARARLSGWEMVPDPIG